MTIALDFWLETLAACLAWFVDVVQGWVKYALVLGRYVVRHTDGCDDLYSRRLL